MAAEARAAVRWDPEQYLKFVDARRRPALDLLAALAGLPAQRIVDLGCGAGHITRVLAARWPQAAVCGVDGDAAMLDKAVATPSTITWECADIAAWRAPSAPDLIFSNAALHWLDDHARLLPQLLAQLRPEGVLAIQMPANFEAPSHRLLRELANEPRWRPALVGARMGHVLSAAEYHRLLAPLCRRLDLWETTYWQVLAGDDAVFEWMKGTTLLPYRARLEGAAGEAFLAAYRARLAAAYPRFDAQSTLFPFKRLFIVAQRG